MSTTYNDLIANAAAWTEDDGVELSAELPEMLALAEARIFKDSYPLACYRNSYSGSTTIGNATVAVTEVIRKIRNMYIVVSGQRVYLDNRNESYLNEYWPSTTATAQPKYFGVYQEAAGITTLRLAGIPDAVYSYQIEFASPLPSLSSGNQTNWLTENMEDTLLYAILLETAIFHKFKEGIDMYMGMYTQSLQKYDIDRLLAEWNAGSQ